MADSLLVRTVCEPEAMNRLTTRAIPTGFNPSACLADLYKRRSSKRLQEATQIQPSTRIILISQTVDREKELEIQNTSNNTNNKNSNSDNDNNINNTSNLVNNLG